MLLNSKPLIFTISISMQHLLNLPGASIKNLPPSRNTFSKNKKLNKLYMWHISEATFENILTICMQEDPHTVSFSFLWNTGSWSCPQVCCLGNEGDSLWSRGEGKTSVIVSHERFSSLVRLLSMKTGFIGVPVIWTLHVNIATMSDIGGLRFAWGWRHKNATLIACITSFSSNPSCRSFGSSRSVTFDLSYNFHAWIFYVKISAKI